MITLSATSIDELNILWKRLRNDFQVIENIHLDQKFLEYRMVIKQPQLTKMLKSVSDKVLDRLDMNEDKALNGLVTLMQLDLRIEESVREYPSLEPLAQIWAVISIADKKAIFNYLKTAQPATEEDQAVEELVIKESS